MSQRYLTSDLPYPGSELVESLLTWQAAKQAPNAPLHDMLREIKLRAQAPGPRFRGARASQGASRPLDPGVSVGRRRPGRRVLRRAHVGQDLRNHGHDLVLARVALLLAVHRGMPMDTI